MSHTEHFVDGIKFTEKRSYSDEMINIDSIMISQIVDEALNGIPTNFNDMRYVLGTEYISNSNNHV